MGNRITEVESPQGFAAEAASAAVILSSSYYGYPLSTTHVVSGGVMGAGAGKRLASVHWGVAGQMATAWLLTIPAAGVMGAVAWEVARVFGDNSTGGTILMAVLAAAAAAVLFRLAQRNKVGAQDLDRTHISPEHEAQLGARRPRRPMTRRNHARSRRPRSSTPAPSGRSSPPPWPAAPAARSPSASLLLGVSRGPAGRQRRARVLNYGIALLAGAVLVAAVVLGIHAMTTKS